MSLIIVKGLVGLVLLAGLQGVRGEVCFSDICIACAEGCSGIENPSIIGSTESTVGDLRQQCSCGCINGFQPCEGYRTSKDADGTITKEKVSDDTVVSLAGSGSGIFDPISIGGGSVSIPASNGGTSSSGNKLTWGCASRCSIQNFSPTLIGDQFTVQEVLRGCMCSGCDGSNECSLELNGETLSPDDTLTSSQVLSMSSRDQGEVIISSTVGKQPLLVRSKDSSRPT
eukprot:jgi/Picsp_1/5186/NSC_02549-R1_---NA---